MIGVMKICYNRGGLKIPNLGKNLHVYRKYNTNTALFRNNNTHLYNIKLIVTCQKKSCKIKW